MYVCVVQLFTAAAARPVVTMVTENKGVRADACSKTSGDGNKSFNKRIQESGFPVGICIPLLYNTSTDVEAGQKMKPALL